MGRLSIFPLTGPIPPLTGLSPMAYSVTALKYLRTIPGKESQHSCY